MSTENKLEDTDQTEKPKAVPAEELELDPPAADEPSTEEDTDGSALPLDKNQIVVINNLPQHDVVKSSQVYLVGDITEEKSEEILASLLYTSEKLTSTSPPSTEEEDIVTIYEPMEIILSTYGGSVVDMFAMYDMIRMLKEKHEITITALGKVMSAGVLLLASGSKGKRRIGRNCRVMLHNVSAGYHGTIPNIQNEIKEIEWLQKKYISCLSEETGMSKRKIRKMLEKGVDVYISAEKAVKYGIVDEII